MFKNIVVGFFMILSTLCVGNNLIEVSAAEEKSQCSGRGCISSIDFVVPIDSFSPRGNKIGGVDVTDGASTEGTMQLLLGVIIKNLIVVFGVLSLLVMTIGGGYMIFHVGEESLLSRGKSIFIYGLVSLAVALSAGLMVQLITYILY